MPPRPPSARIVRPRLLDRLSSDVPVVVVHGPHGAGKSTLLREWCDLRDDAAWVEGTAFPDRLPSAMTIVVDDAEAVTASQWERIDTWISETPGARLRLATRMSIPHIVEWDADTIRDLMFTQGEVTEYLALRGSSADPRTVFIVTTGLPDAVRLVVQNGTVHRTAMVHLLARAYADHALPGHDAELAVPALLTQGTVAELGGDEGFFERAERAGAGWWLDDPLGRVFALTGAVRAATLARNPVGEARQRELHERAARIMTAEQSWSTLVIEAAVIGDLDLVDTAIKRGGMTLLTAQGPMLATVLQAVPIPRLRRHPVTATALAIMFNARRRHRLKALEYLAVALIGLQIVPKESADRALLRALESVARRIAGLGDGGVRAARNAATALSELAPAEAAELTDLTGDLRAHLGISFLYGGQIDDARSQFEIALACFVRPSTELTALGGMALTYALDGDVLAARSWADDALSRSWPSELIDEYPGSMLRIAQARIALEDSDPSTAAALLDRIWPIIDTIEHWPLLAATRALADLAAGDAVSGIERLRALRAQRGARLRGVRPAARHMDAVDALLSLAAGDLVAARKLTVQRSDVTWTRLVVARIALADGEEERALRIVAEAHPVTPADRLGYVTLSAFLLRQLGRVEEALPLEERGQAIRRAFGLGDPPLALPVRDAVLPSPAPPRLTRREQIVLAELVHTGSVEEMAARLHVSPNTVKTQRRSLFRKLGATRREEALIVAVAHGLLDEASLTRDTMTADASTSSDPTANSAT